MNIPPVIIPPGRVAAHRPPSHVSPPAAAPDNGERMTVIEVDDDGLPHISAAADAIIENEITPAYAAGHHPYPEIAGIAGLVRPGMLVDIRV